MRPQYCIWPRHFRVLPARVKHLLTHPRYRHRLTEPGLNRPLRRLWSQCWPCRGHPSDGGADRIRGHHPAEGNTRSEGFRWRPSEHEVFYPLILFICNINTVLDFVGDIRVRTFNVMLYADLHCLFKRDFPSVLFSLWAQRSNVPFTGARDTKAGKKAIHKFRFLVTFASVTADHLSS